MPEMSKAQDKPVAKEAAKVQLVRIVGRMKHGETTQFEFQQRLRYAILFCSLAMVSTMIAPRDALGASGATFDHPSFNRDSSLIVITRCRKGDTCVPWIIDVKAKSVSKIESAAKIALVYARFHPTQDSLLAVKIDFRAGAQQSFVQIDKSGNIVKEFQRNGMFKALPLFYQDGDRFVFVGAGGSGGGDAKYVPRHFDFYETALGSDNAVRVTQLNAYSLYPSLSDSENRIFFSGEGLPKDAATPSRGGFLARLRDMSFRSITSFDADQPVMASNGVLAYIKRTDQLDGKPPGPYTYDVFVQGKGRERRITRLGAYIKRIAISPDGDVIAAVVKTPKAGEELLVMSISGEILNKINAQ